MSSKKNKRGGVVLLWEKPGLGYGWDVALTPTGNIAVTDEINNKVLLYSCDGELKADSSTMGITLHRPRGIAFYKPGNALIVLDMQSIRPRLLDQNTFKHTQLKSLAWQHLMQNWVTMGNPKPSAIGVLGNGNLVTSQIWLTSHESRVAIVRNTSEQPITWKDYNRNPEAEEINLNDLVSMDTPFCVTADHKDRIYVSDTDKNAIFVYDNEGNSVDMIQIKRPWGLCWDGVKNRLLVTECPSGGLSHRIVAIDVPSKNMVEVIKWDKKSRLSLGTLRSVACSGTKLVVLGHKCLQVYELGK